MSVVQPIAIPGLGCITSCGDTVEQCFESLLQGKRNPKPSSLVKTTHKAHHPVFEVIAHPKIDGADSPDLLRTSKFALVAVAEALADAGWTKEELQGKRIGVSLGTTVGCALNNEEFNRAYHSGQHPSMDPILRYLQSNPAETIAREYQLTGPCQTINNACSSATDAIGIAASWIRSGLCDMVIAGGADELCRIVYSGFVSLMNVDEGPSRPFDKDRQGLNLGEGAGIVILEKKPRGSPKAKVIGYGSACDAHHLTAPEPDGDGLRRAIACALGESGKQLSDITFINAHGTGTKENDKVEGKVIHALFPQTPFLSTKGYTGHTLGAAGGVEAVFSIISLVRRVLPINIGFENPDPEIPAIPVVEITEISGNIALSESLAFGGNNAAILLERAD